ncbi:MAG: sulfurtransferase TusA family protein [Pseudoflavonifractor sp.]
MNELDARGYSCPEPVLMTKRALAEGGRPLKVLVDNTTPLENITRFASNAGYAVEHRPLGDDYELVIT